VVHPTSLCGFWHNSDAGLPPQPMPARLPPNKGMPMGVPVRRGGLNGLTHSLPGFEAAAFECQRPQHFPPRFDQVKIGRVDGLKDERPSGMG
jgi:hypothetical protein